MVSEQKIIITNKERVEINSVSSVRALDDTGVLIDSSLGMISVEGSELKIEDLEKSTSVIVITGKISGVYYLEKREKKKGRGLIS